MQIVGGLLIFASVLAFWGGIGWLIVSLIRKGSVRRSLGIILLGMVLLPIGIVVMIAGGDNGDTDAEGVSTLATSPGRTESTPDRADLGKSPASPFGYGVPVVHAGTEVTVLEVKRNYPETAPFFDVKEGHEWVTVTLRLKNVGGSRDEPDHYNELYFRITGKRGVIYDDIFTPNTDNPLGSGDFFGGGEITGDVVREIHKDDGDLVLIYSPTFKGSRYLSLEE